MHCSWNDVVSRSTILLFPECNLRCIHCQRWKDNPLNGEDDWVASKYDNAIENGSFYEQFPRTKVVNVVGGEPMIGRRTEGLLKMLHQAGSTVRLWSNGQFNLDHWEPVLRWTDDLALYLPSPDSDEFRLISGADGLSTLCRTIECARSHGKRVSLFSLISPQLVEWMPYFYDIARDNSIPILFSYYQSSAFSGDEIDFIHRFNWVPNAAVIRLSKRHKLACPAIPFAALYNTREMLRLYGKGWVDILRNQLKI